MKKRRMCQKKPQSTICKIDGCGEPRKAGRLMCARHWEAWRVAYQAEYYAAHTDQAKAYQRQYASEHRKKRGPGAGGQNKIVQNRPKVSTYKPIDLQRLDPTKIIKRWDMVAI
jgi:hypothetical protein